MGECKLKGALVLPKTGGQFPVNWNDPATGALHWGIREWGFHSCFDDGSRNTELDLPTKPGGILDAMRDAKIQGQPQYYRLRLTRDTHWASSPTDPLKFAQRLSDDLKDFKQDGKQCALGIDYEQKNGNWILAVLTEIRRIRSGRGVFWTMEPNQGGWIKDYPALVKFINSDPLVFVVPQVYDLNMNPYGQSDGCRVNIWDAGIDRDKVELYYTLKDKPSWARWSGILYDWNNWVQS